MNLAYLRTCAIPLALCGIALAIQLLGTSATQLLRYERDAVTGGELWRLFTAHAVHLGWSHLAMNLLGLAIIWFVAGHHLPARRWILALAVCSLGTSLALLLFNPEIAWYVGLSGLLHSILVIGAVAAVFERDRAAPALLLLVAAKLLYEQFLGPTPGSAELAGGAVIVDAHLYGALAGLGMGILVAPRHPR